MKRSKSELPGARRFKLLHIFFVVAAFYLIFLSFKFRHILEIASVLSSDDTYGVSVGDSEGGDLSRPFFGTVYKGTFYRRLVDNGNQNSPLMPLKEPLEEGKGESRSTKPIQHGYGRITGGTMRQRNKTIDLSLLERMADEAWTLGLKAWEEVDKFHEEDILPNFMIEGKPTSCPSWVSMNSKEFTSRDRIMFLPCGIAVGSSITVVGTPRFAHQEYVPRLAKLKKGDPKVLISQFVVDLQGGLKSVTGEDPPKILHVNPRLKGDWSHRPVIEHNTFRGRKWGTAQRCNGLPLEDDDDMLVDGHVRCEQWMMNDFVDSKESKSWLGRFIGHPQKPEVTWPFPFVEGRLFVLTLRAGFEGYHIIVGGQHMTSFPYQPGFTLEDATGLAIKGDVDVHSVYATSLPTSHTSFLPHRVLEMSTKWKAHPLPKSHIQLFIGILSATNHFAERMAIRKTWMQSPEIKSSNVVVRFFVALNQKKEVNAVLKKEAAYFGDIVILPFMDHYDIVVLKTIAICEFGVQNVSAAYVMKCDDDTFVRVDTVLKEIKGVSNKRSIYMGNLNLLHRPLRSGKWAVTYKEWPDEAYPPYANGPGYIISSNIAKFIASERANKRLRLFKMEDVSMGMWVEEFNITTPVQYSHNWRFCQYGCMEDYYTAHYQSPRQMICLWEHLSRGRAQCCNFR